MWVRMLELELEALWLPEAEGVRFLPVALPVPCCQLWHLFRCARQAGRGGEPVGWRGQWQRFSLRCLPALRRTSRGLKVSKVRALQAQ